MTRTMTRLPLAMLATTALATSAALAQQQEAPSTDVAECQDLLNYVQENDTQGTGMTQERAYQVVEGQDPQLCGDALRLAQGEISETEGEEGFDADAAARLQIAVPAPDVTVTQQAPDVTVEQPQPEVAVDPGRPVVTVNQREPVITVDMPRPRITIDMPKPEIVVQMPDPSVDVSMPDPQVRVSQADPEVQVEQGQPEVQLGEQTTQTEGGGEQADVTVEQDQAAVTVERGEQAQVRTSEVQPQVQYNAAEPRIEFTESGEPQIEFNQSGEADVQFQQMSGEETQQAAAEQGQEQQTQQQAQAGEEEQIAVIGADDQPTGSGTDQLTAQDILDMTVVGADGSDIGDVEDLVFQGDQAYVIIGQGGFLGLGERQVALPLQDMVHRDDQLVMREVTDQEVQQMEEVNMADFRAAEEGEQVDVNIE
jgi:ribosomal 30S subunit maturation factor RimM